MPLNHYEGSIALSTSDACPAKFNRDRDSAGGTPHRLQLFLKGRSVIWYPRVRVQMGKDAMHSDRPDRAARPIGPSGKHLMRFLPILLLLAACATSAPSSVPYPIEDFYKTNYPSKPDHKAFALATGASGYASGYSYGYSVAKEAIASAMRVCNERKATYNVNETCRLYAVDHIVVWGKSDEEMEAVSFWLYYSRGLANHRKGDYDQAIRDYDEAIRINPEDANAYNNRCWTYGLMHRPDEALRDCNQSLRLRPDNAPTLDSRALIYWSRGDEDKARDDLEHASKIDSSLPAWQERFREFKEMF